MAVNDPLIGKKLGDYTIQSLLGRGGMSRVYRGYDENLDRYAAVKVISGDFATTSEEEYTRRFQTEARAIARLRHENIVGVYQFGRTEGIYYMAQVFLEGKDLRTLMKEYAARGMRIPQDELLRIVSDITRALDYAHEQGVIHRDIKPSNIMLERRTGRAILMDFGLALSVHEGSMGDTFGSAHYIAPEQAISSAKSVPQSDLYSLGVVIYEMLAGTVPFDDPSVMSVALKHLNELPPPPSMHNPDLPPAVEAVIMRLLDKDPNRRYATGRQLYSALAQAFEPASDDAGAPVAPFVDEPSSRPSRPDARDSETAPPQTAPDELPGGLASRFARRQQDKEVQAALEAGEGLAIDDAMLSSILDGYADPRELGLTDSSISPAKHARQQDAAPSSPPRKRRRSRAATYLFSILLLVILLSVAWFGLGLNDRNGGDDAASGAATPTVAARDLTATGAALLPAPSSTPYPPLTPRAASPTVPVTLTAVAVAPTDAPTAAPTDLPAGTPTGAPPPTATDQPTVTPTELLAEPPTEPPTELPTASTVPASATLPPTVAAVPAASVSPEPPDDSPAPNIRLIYTEETPGHGQFLLLNMTGDTLDISQLVFERARPDGGVLRYEARWWDRAGISASPSTMPGHSCFQLVTSNGTYRTASGGNCPIFLGYYRTNLTERYFWLADEPGAAFTVRTLDADEPLATCVIEATTCAFYAGPEVLTVIATPALAESETLTASGAGSQLRLLYDANSFLITNTSAQQVDISALVFEQQMADGTSRRFEAIQWNRPDVAAPPFAMRSGGCYQLVTATAPQSAPSDDDCAHFLGWFRTSVSRRYFWLADQADSAFTVRRSGGDTVLATCAIADGECTFILPDAGE